MYPLATSKPMKATNSAKRKETLRHEIMTIIQAHGLDVTGDFWFALIFRTEAELKKICRELCAKCA